MSLDDMHYFSSGMKRSAPEGKLDYTLVYDGPLFRRWVEHMNAGASVYGPRNWLLGTGPEEMGRYKISATRHFHQWLEGHEDEDHPAAVCFNLNGYEYVKRQLRGY